MGKVKHAPQAAPVAADSSWSSELAQQLHPAVRHKLIAEEQTTFDSVTNETRQHEETNECIKYQKIVTYKVGRERSRKKHYYACHSPQHICTHVSVYEDQHAFFNHIRHQHKPHILCVICSKQIAPSQYKSHYEACSRIKESGIRQAHNQQAEDIEQENDMLLAELNDAGQQTNVNNMENKLIGEISDDYIPKPRSKQEGSCTYSTPLLRVETLQYFDLDSPINDNATGQIEYKEWSPQCCEKADNCNVVQHGTFVRFCYDMSEAFLVEIKRYKCTTHNTVQNKRKSNITFNMLSECVDKQMNKKLTVRKSLDLHLFDTVLITSDLWTTIANNTLVTLNDSHVNTMIKHSYRRCWLRKLALHMDHKRDPLHTCTARECYGLTMNKADEWVKLYHTISQRALDIVTTRALYQRHIFPQAVLPLHNKLQHTIITQHCGTAISMDHTFKMAKFGLYNELINDTTTVAATGDVTVTCSDVVMQRDEIPSNAVPNSTASSTTLNSTTGKRKRKKYNQSVTFTKLNAQLLTVMDSNGYALCSYVVPCGKASYELRCMQMLLSMQHEDGKPVRIKTVSVDNASQIGQSLKTHYKLTTNEELTVLQDLYHARERIEREFVFGHPLIREARADWRKLIGDVINARCTIDVWKENMIKYRDKYSSPVKYSAVGEMAMVSQVAKTLLVNDPIKQEQVLSGDEMVERYSRHHPNDIDDSNNIVQAVLRQPGVTALNNLINDANIAYVFDRTQAHCVNTKGTTPNEALHRIFNGRLSRFGGIRTFATAQQCIIVIQYQYNTQKLYDSSQYWCDIHLLPICCIRQDYCNPLGEPDKDILQRLEIEWTTNSKWMPSHTVRLHELLISLSIGELYCHTKSLCQWLSQQEGMEGTKPSQIGKKLRDMQAELLTSTSDTPPTVPLTSSSSAITSSIVV